MYLLYERRARVPSSVGHPDTLKTADVALLIRILAGLGVRKIRFTGGEPLLRNDIAELVRTAKDTVGIETVSLTTNGVLLHKHLDGLRKAGLDALNLEYRHLPSTGALSGHNPPGRIRTGEGKSRYPACIEDHTGQTQRRDDAGHQQ